MAKLTAAARKKISGKNFAGPDRSYPIEDASHARNALSRVSQHGSPALKARVRAKVHAKYPGIGKSSAGSIKKQARSEHESVAHERREHMGIGKSHGPRADHFMRTGK